MKKLYPLKFKPIFKEKIWGGTKIKTKLNKDFSPLSNCGETWELSAVQGNISEVANGPLAGQLLDSLLEQRPEEILGKRVAKQFGTEFPLLIKFLDAHEDLSVQVHPNDELAKARHNGFGKTEMWYILQADEGASLIAGFNRPLDKESYKSYFEEGKLSEILNRVEAEAGDVFYIPAGRIHTIGKGILLAEIQQTSDLTYRIYDFDRVDSDGNKRELHTEEAIDALDYTYIDDYKTQYTVVKDQRSKLVESPYFMTNKFEISTDHSLDYTQLDSFAVFIFTKGSGEIRYEDGVETYSLGDVVLVPASLGDVQIMPSEQSAFLEVYMP